MINPSLRRLPLDVGISDIDAVQHYLTWLLSLVCVVVLFVNLGSADFFEPDEGRNAEKAREILLLNDWVTPHENFLPVLDKPMSFYWLVAFAYKIFGITEWSARLPSILFALGCLLLVYRFARQWWGSWEAMWSVLILLTSVEFFLLARIVRSDMALTFSATLALCSFYSAIHAEKEKARKLHCFLMYGGLAAGTLIKGLVGLIIPGMVFFVYLLLTHQWSILRRLHLLPGALLCFVIVVPWYLWADARNPGYLRYYFWDDHVTRYLTDEFGRTKSWFYFLFVVAVGFLPWTLCLPFVAKDCWQKLDDKKMFLVLWVVLPFLFFSGSNSKLPHYVLPIYPALAISSRANDRQPFHNDETKRKMVFVSAVELRGELYPLSADRSSLGAFFTHTNSQECKRQFRLHRFLCRLDGVHIWRLYVRQFEGLWEKPTRRLPLQLWGHRAFLLARGPVHGDGLR